MIKDWYGSLDKYEKISSDVSNITKGIYWTKNKQFSSGLGFYSDLISDYYWTLVTRITAEEGDIDLLIDESTKFFSSLGKQFSLYVYPSDRKRGVEEWISDRGFETVISDGWMFYDGDWKVQQTTDPRIKVREVTTDEDNEIYIDTYTRAYETDPTDVYFDYAGDGVYQELYRTTWMDSSVRDKIHRFVAFYNNEPGASGALYYKDGLGYISEVGTDPKFRKKGLANIVSNSCLQAAINEDCEVLCLITEKDSPAYKLYKKFGFEQKVLCRGWAVSQ